MDTEQEHVLSLSQSVLVSKVLEFNSWDQNPNKGNPQLGLQILEAKMKLSDGAVQGVICSDPVLSLLFTNTLNHLKHVSLNFTTEEGSEDYPHADVLEGPFPTRPSLIALEKVNELFEIIESTEEVENSALLNPLANKRELVTQQRRIIDHICEDPIDYYTDFYERLKIGGPNTPFPEFLQTVHFLGESLLSNSELESLCNQNKYMARFRQLTLSSIDTILREALPYSGTIIAIDRTLELFDILQRFQMGKTAPELYHSRRYEYYLHYLLAEKNHILFPTISNISPKDLIRLRAVPIGIAGVADHGTRVDGFVQTSSEFFYHDIDHARRKHQFFIEAATTNGLTVQEFAEYSNDFIRGVLIPEITPVKNQTEVEREIKKTETMLIFEILHEDALVAAPSIVFSAIMQPPLHRTPFERMEENDVVYFMELEAPNVACVYQKLAGEFFDMTDKRNKIIGGKRARSKEGIVDAATRLVQLVRPQENSGNYSEDIERLVSVDDKFPFDVSSEN